MSRKSMDKHNRWRSLTIAFRISPEENEILNRKVYLSGVTKQAFIINHIIESEPLNVVVNRKIIFRLSERIERLTKLLENSKQLFVCDIEELDFIAKTLAKIIEEEQKINE